VGEVELQDSASPTKNPVVTNPLNDLPGSAEKDLLPRNPLPVFPTHVVGADDVCVQVQDPEAATQETGPASEYLGAQLQMPDYAAPVPAEVPSAAAAGEGSSDLPGGGSALIAVSEYRRAKE
jgi:hypothetical protein